MLWQRTTWHCNTTDKKWCAARDDEQWKTNLDPDHIDVTNVHKLLLSTSALEHRGVTIIFNHDDDHIFRNETVNLVSHDCHSYLHVIMANRIPPCKTLVMAGGSATNDVDEATIKMETREMRLEKLKLVIDEQSPMRIKSDSLIFQVKRKLQYHYVLLKRRQMLREWHTTRHMFHSEIGVRSVLRFVEEVLRTDELW